MKKSNAFYAQSGGVTAVINASACGVIETARKYPDLINNVYAGRNGIIGGLTEDLIDTSLESDEDIATLKHTPAGAFGSCRYKLKNSDVDNTEYDRLLEVFKAHDIKYFFYNGGGDSQDTSQKLAAFCQSRNYPLSCIGIPKTVDNDLPCTDTCPGFGSVAKYVAVSISEAAFDVSSMAKTSTKVFIMEVMGRHAGWIAASGGLANIGHDLGPHLILFPEIPFEQATFLKRVKQCVDQYGFCVVVASEGVKTIDGHFLSESGTKDAFGHAQLGGAAPVLAELIRGHLGYKYHWAVADYLQRSARHIASETDVEQAYAVGQAAVEMALGGENSVMTTIVRTSNDPYLWEVGKAQLTEVANVEKNLPREYITSDGFGITDKCRAYLLPLISGESYPPYRDGIPNYTVLKNYSVKRKLHSDFLV